MKVLVMGGIAQSLVNFRGPLLRTMVAGGHDVLACAGEPREEVTETLRTWGVRFVPVRMNRAGMHPLEDLNTYRDLRSLVRQFQPDVVLAYTIKPVIWGGFAARSIHPVSFYSLITGLGYAFTGNRNIRSRIAGLAASFLYRIILRKSRRVFFQNPDDLEEFILRGLVKKERCLLINGSGVDLAHYVSASLPTTTRFLMICRLLEDKGVREYIEAARTIRFRSREAWFGLAGPLDPNPASVSREELEQWQREGVIDYLGVLDDVRPAYAKCSIYVLPSYREGTPRTVLEAMSMGRPVITTNVPGCRETIKLPDGMILEKSAKKIIEGENGFLVPPRDVGNLVEAMAQFLDNPDRIEKMGRRSREIATEKYDVHKVNACILDGMGLA